MIRRQMTTLRGRIRLLSIAAVAAVFGILLAALPAQAAYAKYSDTAIDGSGRTVAAVRWNDWLGTGNVSGVVNLKVDASGGYWYTGTVRNAYVAGRNIRYTCTISFANGEKITVATSRYWVSGGDSKTWNWPRIQDGNASTIVRHWNEMWGASNFACALNVG